MATEIKIGFDLDRYPTLKAFAESPAKIRITIGPAGCLPAEAEVLTPDGWVPMSTPVDRALVYDPDLQTAFFDDVIYHSMPCDVPFYRFHNSTTLDMPVSPDHKVWYQTPYEQGKRGMKAAWSVLTGEDLAQKMRELKGFDARIPTTFSYSTSQIYPLSEPALRVMVMVAADGSLPSAGKNCILTVRKDRKKERVRYLLNEAGIEFRERTYANRPTETIFSFVPPEWSKDLTRFYSASEQQLRIIADECMYWDAHRGVKGAYFSSSDKRQADFIQFAFAASGYASMLTEEVYPNKNNWANNYRATQQTKSRWVNLKTSKVDLLPATDGKQYCLETETGMFVARYNGKIFVTGNSAKTSYCVMELLRLAMLQEPSPQDNVRYSMAVVVRNTYDLLIKSTVPTFKRMLGPLYRGKDSIPPVGQVIFPMADGTTVNLLINFMSVDSPEDEKKFLGFEPTFVFIDEVSECSESLIHAAVRRLGRYPSGALGKCTRSCLIAATNGPIEGHWLHHWWLGHEDEKHQQIARQMGIPVYAEIFKQPPALLRPLDPDGEWLPNPEAENVHNLADGYGYYYAMLGGSPESIAAYVEGDFASISMGRRVYREFNTQMHVAPDRALRPNQPYYYLLSFDFGRTPVCLLGTVTPEGSLYILDEFMGEDISVSQLWDETVSPSLRRHYKGWMCEDATGDPAGMIEDQTTPLSPYKVLVKKGVPIRPVVNNNKYEARHNAVRYWLTQLNSSGKPKLQISDKCRFLIDALNRTYIYEKVRGQTDVYKEQPTKSHVNWASDLADAFQYVCLLAISITSNINQSTVYTTKPQQTESTWLG